MNYKQFTDATGLPVATYYNWVRNKRPFLSIMMDGVPHMYKIKLEQSLSEIFKQHHTMSLAQHIKSVDHDLCLRKMYRWQKDPTKKKLLKAYLAGVFHGNKTL